MVAKKPTAETDRKRTQGRDTASGMQETISALKTPHQRIAEPRGRRRIDVLHFRSVALGVHVLKKVEKEGSEIQMGDLSELSLSTTLFMRCYAWRRIDLPWE